MLWAFSKAVQWMQSLLRNTLAGPTRQSTGLGASDTQGGFFSISQMLQPSLGPSSYLSCCSLLESMNCHVLTDTPGLQVTAWEGKASGLAHSSACPLGQEHHRDFTLYPHTTSKL